MARILVIYDSRTGNTEKMASAVAKGAEQIVGVHVVLKKIDQATLEDLTEAEGIIMGSPTYYGQMSGKMKTFVDQTNKIHGKLRGKVGGAFTSSGDTACGAETTLFSMLQTMLIHGMIIQGRYDNKHYGATAVGVPSEKELESCKELGKRIADLTVKIYG
jgi:NAD(P)H dehydrogenase (quinone)